MDFKVAGTARRASPPCRWTSRSPASRSEIMRDALEQAKRGPRVHPRQDGRGDRRAARGARRARAADLDDQDRPREDRHGHRQGRRDDPRASRTSTSARSTSRRTARSSSTRPTGTKGDAAIAAIESMTKEAEVGDTYTGKVVKTTDVRRLRRAEEGHRRPAARLERRPGPRSRTSRTCINRGDVIDVARAGGRQGARPDRPEARRQARERRRSSRPRS